MGPLRDKTAFNIRKWSGRRKTESIKAGALSIRAPVEPVIVPFDHGRFRHHRGQETAEPLINDFSGEPFHVALVRSSGSVEFTRAELGLATTTVTGGMDMSFEDSYGMWCVHHFNQDGLIRTA